MLRQVLDLVFGDPQMIQPLHADLFAGAIPHGLFDVVARCVAEQAVDPAHELALGLIPELGLTVECPAEQPAGIPRRDDAARDSPAAERVTLADVLDVGHDAFVQHGDRGAHPIGLFRIGAELFRAAKGSSCAAIFFHRSQPLPGRSVGLNTAG